MRRKATGGDDKVLRRHRLGERETLRVIGQYGDRRVSNWNVDGGRPGMAPFLREKLGVEWEVLARPSRSNFESLETVDAAELFARLAPLLLR